MTDDKFTIEATIDSLFGSAPGTVSVELTPQGTAILSQDGVQITVAASQVAILQSRLAAHIEKLSLRKK